MARSSLYLSILLILSTISFRLIESQGERIMQPLNEATVQAKEKTMGLHRIFLTILRDGAIMAGSPDEIQRARRLADAEIARLPFSLGIDVDWPPRVHPRNPGSSSQANLHA
jgi:hypothetical protein